MGKTRNRLLVIIIVIIILSFSWYAFFKPRIDNLSGGCSDHIGDRNDFGNVHIDGEGNTIMTGHDLYNRMPKTKYYGIDHDDESYNLLVVKFDINGNLVFSLSIGGNGTDYLSESEIDSKDNIIISGVTSSPTFLNHTITNSRLFIIKISSVGEILWDIIIDGATYSPNLSIDESDNIYLLGNNNGFLEEFNVTKLYDHANRPSFDDHINSIVLLKFSPTGGIMDYVHIFASTSVYTYDMKISNGTIFLHLKVPEVVFDTIFPYPNGFVALNSSFALIWTRAIPSISISEFEIYNQGIMFFGNIYSSHNNFGYITYLNGSGEEEWTHKYDIYYGLGSYVHQVEENVFYSVDSSIYRIIDNSERELILNFTGKIDLYDFISRDGIFVIFGETSNNQILNNSSFQHELKGTKDAIILSFSDIENVTPSNWNDKLSWGTYFGGETYTYQICLD